ncbi:MAG: hypothetical protein NC828_05370 [Candidatus Omnitrophica bacterium]|nr:hypothetical protein [Candidatus Omnitrophota bacterium]
MATLSSLFHAIANWHNKITIAAGCTREFLKSKPLDTLTKEELKSQQEKLVQIFDKIESDTVNASQKVIELKREISKKINLSKEEL